MSLLDARHRLFDNAKLRRVDEIVGRVDLQDQGADLFEILAWVGGTRRVELLQHVVRVRGPVPTLDVGADPRIGCLSPVSSRKLWLTEPAPAGVCGVARETARARTGTLK